MIKSSCMFYTYILIGVKCPKTYVGHTNDWERRLLKHNSGYGVFTKRYGPWKIIHKEEFLTEKESIKREKYFKSAAGRRWMKKNLFENARVAER